jgi:hypothetical protein
MTPIKQTVLLPDDVALRLRLKAAEMNVSQQEIMLAAIRSELNQDDKALAEEQIPDSEREINVVVDLLQTFDFDTEQLKVIHKELGRMVTVPNPKRKTIKKVGK